jgi:hypothetical protein
MKNCLNYISKVLLLLPLLFISCTKDSHDKAVTAGCDSSNTVFNQLYSTVVNNAANVEQITMDSELHSYTFEVTSPATICKIGYQSQPTFETYPYVIELFDNTTNTLVYSGSHTFSSASTEYVSITPVILTVGNSYTINRIQNNFPNDTAIFIGRIVGPQPNSNGQLTFPYTFGNLKITGTSFGANAGSDDYILPYIDLVFE